MKHYPLKEYSRYDTIVLANGLFPTSDEPLSFLQRWLREEHRDFLACCDGAVDVLRAYCDKLPDVVVGDLDSLSSVVRDQLGDRLVHIAEQETNDLTKTINHLSKVLSKRRVILLGATGKREDHTLGNLSLLPSYADLLDELVVLSDTGYFRLVKESCSLEVEEGGQISFFSFEPKPFSVSGVCWPFEDYTLPYLWSGTLNRAKGPIVTIKTQHPILVFVAY